MSKSAFQQALAPNHKPRPKGKPATPPSRGSAEPATLAQIKAACTGCDAAFAVDQVERGATLPQAKTAHINTLAAKLQNRDAELARLEREQARKRAEALKAKDEAIKAKDEELEQAKLDLENVRVAEVFDDRMSGGDSGGSAFDRSVRGAD